MPQGCDFTCHNKACPNHGETIVMHGVWPTKPIRKAIVEAQCRGDMSQAAALQRREDEWRKVALFVYPADKQLSPAGYRLQLYCPACLIVEDVDCGRDPKEAKDKADNPTECGKCHGARKSLKSSVATSLPCPSCGVALHQFHWFTK
jgi:hypothetical protein